MSLRLFYKGALASCPASITQQLLVRNAGSDSNISARTSEIIDRVRANGDRALFELAEELDGVRLSALEVPKNVVLRALDLIDTRVRQALERARDNIARVHKAGMPVPHEVVVEPGIRVGRRPDPLARVGVYAPGGRAAYPSSVLMGCVPARIAGVKEVLLASPPGPDGVPSNAVLAAAALSEVDTVFAVGGAGAIAALALGTRTIPRVDLIVGPGNCYVAEAKNQLSRTVRIDSFAGPSELVVIADESASPLIVAREMIAQAEHDPDARVVALLVGDADPDALERALDCLIASQPRRDVIAASLVRHGAILSVIKLEQAIAFSSAYAPEHLLLAVSKPEEVLPVVRNAGTVFLGLSSSVAFGDYLTGANHVLPTAGFARIQSGLSTSDFLRWTTFQQVDTAAASALADDVCTLAAAEGLPGHVSTARQWGTSGASV
jgi:histidinol dehydrogenase